MINPQSAGQTPSFAGFTDDQLYQILKGKLGYTGPPDPVEMSKAMSATPDMAAGVGKYAEMAQRAIDRRLAEVQGAGKNVTPDRQAYATGGAVNLDATSVPKATLETAINSPEKAVTTADVDTITPTTGQMIPTGAGQQTETHVAESSTVPDPVKVEGQTAEATTAQATEPVEAQTYEAKTVTDEMESTLEGLQAATAQPTESATVRGQLESLMGDFDEGTPPWASGAMRQATALMQTRGLGASSMAGEAIVLAAMQAALPIASQDAQTQAQFELQNLNNEQQTTIFKAQQRMAGLFSDQASVNAAAQFNAQSENQTNQFFAQLETTVSQFNAAQINGIRQFNAEQLNISDRFNVEQQTTVDLFKAKQEDAMSQFNAQIQQQRDQFNAQNSLLVQQANAKWLQDVSTINTAEQNLANRDAAAAANTLTSTAMNTILQYERDILAYTFQSGENAADRQLSLVLADKQLAVSQQALDDRKKEAMAYSLAEWFW